MMTKFDLEKCQRNEQGHYLCQTRDGRPARVVCVDAVGEQPLIALSDEGDGTEAPSAHNCDGAYHTHGAESPWDLVNLPVKRAGWINIYPGAVDQGNRVMSGMFATEADADRRAGHLRIGPAIKIEWEE